MTVATSGGHNEASDPWQIRIASTFVTSGYLAQLSASAAKVCLVLCLRANWESRKCTIPIAQIAREADVGERTATRSLPELISAGLVEVKKRYKRIPGEPSAHQIAHEFRLLDIEERAVAPRDEVVSLPLEMTPPQCKIGRRETPKWRPIPYPLVPHPSQPHAQTMVSLRDIPKWTYKRG
jgi:hypothetical protein